MNYEFKIIYYFYKKLINAIFKKNINLINNEKTKKRYLKKRKRRI